MTDLMKLLRLHTRTAVKNFERDGNLYAPVWLLENERGVRMLLATPMDGPDMAKVARDAIRHFGAVRYAFATEMWFLMPNEHEGLTMKPSESPHRREGIHIHGEDIKGERRSITYEIKRETGRKPYLTKLDSNTDFSGRLSDMFAVGPYL